MPLIDLNPKAGALRAKAPAKSVGMLCSVAAAACAIAAVSPACAATLSRSVDVNANPSAVWAMIGPFCAIKDWHPAIGACATDGKTPPTRSLVTRDGKARFVELQTGRSDAKHRYSYAFVSSPLPVTHYRSTIQVIAKGGGVSTVIWAGDYTPDAGTEKQASDALTGIYESGLAAIKARFAN